MAQYLTGDADGKHFEFKASKGQLARAPAWLPEAENPPLSARRARDIARKQISQLVRHGDTWDLQRISISDMGDHRHWIYVVEFARRYPDNTAVTFGEHLEIPVLMNGTVLKPKIRPSEIPRR